MGKRRRRWKREWRRRETAARHLLFCLYIYPNYRVDSRGPAGCILRAIEAMDPHMARLLRDGTEPREIYNTRYPNL